MSSQKEFSKSLVSEVDINTAFILLESLVIFFFENLGGIVTRSEWMGG